MSTTCYPMDGTSYSSSTTYLPCNLTAVANNAHSACCAYNDLCLTNGLCRNPDNDAKGLNHYWQVGCTDETFEDAACPKYCQNPSTSGTSSHPPFHIIQSHPTPFPLHIEHQLASPYIHTHIATQLTSKPSDSSRDQNHFILKCLDAKSNYCCAPNDLVIAPRIMTDCCTDSSLTFEAAEPVAYTTARLAEVPRSSASETFTALGSPASLSQRVSSAAADATGSNSTPTTSSSTSIPTNTSLSANSSSSTSSGLSTGTKIGLGVGVSLGALLLLLVSVAVWWSRRKAAAREMERASVQGNGGYHQDVAEIDGFVTQRIPKAPVEMAADGPPMYSR